MTRIEGEIVINRPLEEVFDFVADERNEPRYNPRMLRARRSRLGRSVSRRASAPRRWGIGRDGDRGHSL
jgi:hypothetical protein